MQSADPEQLRVINFCHQILETSSKIECNSCKQLYTVDNFVEHLNDCRSPSSSSEWNPMLMAAREENSLISNVSNVPAAGGPSEPRPRDTCPDSHEPCSSNEDSPRYMFDENLSDFISAGEIQKNQVRVAHTAPQIRVGDSTQTTPRYLGAIVRGEEVRPFRPDDAREDLSAYGSVGGARGDTERCGTVRKEKRGLEDKL